MTREGGYGYTLPYGQWQSRGLLVIVVHCNKKYNRSFMVHVLIPRLRVLLTHVLLYRAIVTMTMWGREGVLLDNKKLLVAI